MGMFYLHPEIKTQNSLNIVHYKSKDGNTPSLKNVVVDRNLHAMSLTYVSSTLATVSFTYPTIKSLPAYKLKKSTEDFSLIYM